MKRNIIILVDALVPGGAETLAVNSAIGLKNLGHYNPIVCATRREGNVLEERLRENGIEFISLGRNWTFEIHRFSHLVRIIRERNVEVIHAHKDGSNFWGAIIGKLAGVSAIIAHVHGGISNLQNRMMNKVVASLSDKVIAVSESERRKLIEKWHFPDLKVIKIYNGVNANGYRIKPNLAIRKELGLEADCPTVGIVAGLRPEKDHKTFLLSASKILKEFKNAYFLIVGDGIEREKLEGFTSELGISRNCIFTGYRRDVSDILSIIDVGVLCSEREGLPLTLLEYMFSSKPIVATRVGGVPEVVQEGFNGFLVPPCDYNALAYKISLLLKNKDLALEMGRNGLSFVKQNFTIEAMLKKLEDLYNHILETKLSRSRRN
ncbi:MAG: glycosyltransferase [Nitrososphaerota archaeon]